MNRLAALVLFLGEGQGAVADVVRTKAPDISTALTCVEEKFVGQTRYGANRVPSFVGLPLCIRPRMMTFTRILQHRNITDNIPLHTADVAFYRPLEENPQGFEPVVSGSL